MPNITCMQGDALLPRRLAASMPIPIRISPEYQLPPAVSASTAARVTEVVSAAILTLQSYLKARTPPDGPKRCSQAARVAWITWGD